MIFQQKSHTKFIKYVLEVNITARKLAVKSE